MNENNKKNLSNKGIVIAEVLDKQVRKDKNKDTYWILKLSICKRLTEMYFELKNEKHPTLLSNDKHLYVFLTRIIKIDLLIIWILNIFIYLNTVLMRNIYMLNTGKN